MRSFIIRLFLLLGFLFPALALALGPGSWSAKVPLPVSNSGAAAAVYNGLLYNAGGSDNVCNAYSTLEAYDPLTDTWTAKAAMPTARWGLGASFVNGILYAVGGTNVCDTPIYSMNTVEAYDPITNTWTTKASIPTNRFAPGVGVVNGILYVVGGVNGSSTLATVEAYDPTTDTWTTKASMPTARFDLSVGVVNGILYAIGGVGVTGALGTVEAYDPTSDTWTTMTSMPTARNGLSVGVIDGIIYAVGGSGNAGALATVEAYDPTSDTWTTMASMPTARAGLSVGVVNNVLYAVGGVDVNNVQLTTNEAFNPLPPLAISTSSLPDATGLAAYNQTLSATGGTAPYTWAVSGSLPAGLSLNPSTGVISGTPTTAGSSSFSVSVTDAASTAVSKVMTITVVNVDLSVSALTSSADGHSVNVGDTVTINSTISNLGSSATTIGIPVFFYLSTDSNITMSDTLLSGTGLLGLAAGQSSNLTTTVTLPLNLAPGTYYIGAIVDPANYQHESNEANNTRATATPFTVVRNVDLSVTATSTVDGLNTVRPGDPVTITAIVHNAGSTTTTAPVIAVSYYLSTDATITQADRPIGASGLYSLAAGASGATSVTVNLPLDLVPGATYYIGAIVDPSNAQPETNKANNSNTLQPPTSFTVAANAIADLTVSAPSYTAINVLGGDTFTVSATVNNIGNAATTAPIAVSYYLTTDPNPAHLTTTTGTLVGTSGVPGLAAGGSSSTSATVALPLDLAAGTYYIGAIVDAGNVQPELSKTNNTAVGAAFTVLASSVDLTISTPTYTLSGTPMSGSPITINPVTVTNNGNAPTTAPIVVSYYLTMVPYAPDLPETGILIGSSGVPGLAAGGSSNTSTVTMKLPLNLEAGTYYIGAYVNPGNVQPESNTANNGEIGAWIVVTASTVQLTVSSLGSVSLGHTVHAGHQVTINANVYNGGNAATTGPVAVSYYLTTDPNAADLPGSGIAIGASGISHIAAGSSANTFITVTLPLTLPPNTYHIGVIVDPTNAEAVETNNKAVTAGTLTVTSP